MNRTYLKRTIQWRGEVNNFLSGLLQVDYKHKPKVENISDILEILKDEFPEY